MKDDDVLTYLAAEGIPFAVIGAHAFAAIYGCKGAFYVRLQCARDVQPTAGA